MRKIDIKNKGTKNVEIICLVCNSSFLKRLNDNTKYCSRDCYSRSRRSKVLVKCAACEKEFYKKPSSLKQSRSGLFFCTRECKDKSQRIGGIEEIMPDHYKNDTSEFERQNVENSVALKFPKLASEWHPTLNGKLTPYNVSIGSIFKIWWKCSNNHEWRSTCSNRTLSKYGCPYCANRRVCSDNCLATTHPEIAKEWHPTKNGNLTPHDVVAGSPKIIWWKCPVADDHEWKTTISNRKRGNNNCPFCSNKKLCKSNSLGVANPDLAKEFHATKNENLTPFDIVNGGVKKVWWQCQNNLNHSWKASVATRKQGFSCPLCKSSYGEKKILEYLIKKNIDYKTQFKFKLMQRKLRYDFYILNKRICLIEYNGQQHYVPVHFGSKKEGFGLENFKGNRERDKIKADYCKENGIELLIIPYWDFDRIEEILDSWFNNEEVVFSEEPEIVKKYKEEAMNTEKLELDPKQMDEQYHHCECDKLRADIQYVRLGKDENIKDQSLANCPIETIHFSKGGIRCGGGAKIRVVDESGKEK